MPDEGHDLMTDSGLILFLERTHCSILAGW